MRYTYLSIITYKEGITMKLKVPKHKARTLSIMEILDLFATEADAVRWFELVRWNGKPACPRCGATERLSQSPSKPFKYWCKACSERFTVRIGTVMEESRLPLQKWAIAMYYTLTARKGISSMQLSKELKVTQKTAWFLLQRIREACRRAEVKLDDIVEIDEVYIGGKNKNRHLSKRAYVGRGTAGKQAVLGLHQRRGPTTTVLISGTDKATLTSEVVRHVAEGAYVCTDEHGAYQELNQLGYRHQPVNHSAGEYVKQGAHTNGIESVWAVLRRSLYGVYHNVSLKHLPKYLNEVAFRLHEGNVQVDTLERMVALTRGMVGKRLMYKQLIRDEAA